MAETITDMFVEFDKFCKDCKYYDKNETEEPCNECLTNPTNINSVKPVMFKEASGTSKTDNKKGKK